MTAATTEAAPVEDQRTVIVKQGADKEFDPFKLEPGVDGPYPLWLYAGTLVHGVYAAKHAGLSEAEYQVWREDHYGDAPSIVQAWVQKAEIAATAIDNELRLNPRVETQTAHEVRLYLGQTAFRSAAFLERRLITEQEAEDQKVGPIEYAMQNNPWYNLQGPKKVIKYQRLLRDWDDPSIDAATLDHHIRNTRTHYMTYGNKLIVCPTSRPDIIQLQYDEDDIQTRNIANAFLQVLDAGIGYSPDRLSTEMVEYHEYDEAKDETRRFMIPACDAMYLAAERIARGKLGVDIVDIKTIPHLGTIYFGLEPAWEKHGGHLPAIFSQSNIHSKDVFYHDVGRMWLKWENDVSKTINSFRVWLAKGVEEFLLNNPDNPTISNREVMKHVNGSVLMTDFDISNPETAANLPNNGNRLDYPTVPHISEVGIPEQVTVYRKAVRRTRIKRYIEHWERKVYRLARLAQFAVKQAMREDDEVLKKLDRELDMQIGLFPATSIVAPVEISPEPALVGSD